MSELLDPRRQAAGDGGAPDGAADEAAAWAAEDAAALASQLADLAELRGLAMGLARAAAARAVAVEVEADSPPPSARCADTSPARGGGIGAVDLPPPSARRADTSPVEGGGGSASSTFDRLARTVRLTAAMENRLRAARAKAVADAAAARAAQKSAVGAGRIDEPSDQERREKSIALLIRMAERKQVIVGVVEEMLVDAGHDAEVVADVGRALGERLVDFEPGDVAKLPIGRMVARTCKQLGLEPDWSKWKDADWAVEEAETKAKGSPFGDPAFPVWYMCAGVPGYMEGEESGWAGSAGPPPPPRGRSPSPKGGGIGDECGP